MELTFDGQQHKLILTDDEFAQLEYLYIEKCTPVKEIARYFNISPSVMDAQLIKLGLVKKKSEIEEERYLTAKREVKTFKPKPVIVRQYKEKPYMAYDITELFTNGGDYL